MPEGQELERANLQKFKCPGVCPRGMLNFEIDQCIMLSLRKMCNLQFAFTSVGMRIPATKSASCHKISRQKCCIQYECDIWHSLTWMQWTFGPLVSSLASIITKFNFTCIIFDVTISSRYSSDIHRNVVTSIFLSLQNLLILLGLSPRLSIVRKLNINEL